MKHLLVIPAFLVVSCIVSAQKEIEIKAFDSQIIDSLNSDQIKLDSLDYSYYNKRLNDMKSGEAFLPGVSDSAIGVIIHNETIMFRRRAENLTKYYLNYYKNDSLRGSSHEDFYSETMCFMKDSSVTISFGNNIFGGFGFEISINQNTFVVTYEIDAYKEKIYKVNEEDSEFKSQITVDMKDATLQLTAPLSFNHGTEIKGKLDLTTSVFYRASDYEPYLFLDDHRSENPDLLYVDGTVLFKCRTIDLDLIKE